MVFEQLYKTVKLFSNFLGDYLNQKPNLTLLLIKSVCKFSLSSTMKLFLLSLCFISIFGNFAHSISIEESAKLNYRLNTDIEPLDYIIDVTPYFDGNVSGKEPFTFDGITTITIKAKKANIDTITLHKLHLNILEEDLIKKSKQFAKKVEKINIKSHEYNNRTEKYTLNLATALVKDELYVLTFKYTGSLTNGKGFYRTAYKEGDITK